LNQNLLLANLASSKHTKKYIPTKSPQWWRRWLVGYIMVPKFIDFSVRQSIPKVPSKVCKSISKNPIVKVSL